MNKEDLVGKVARVYMKGGIIFHGVIISWSDGSVEIRSPQGEGIFIPDEKEISAYKLIVKSDGSYLSSSDNSDSKTEDQNERIKSLVEQHAIAADSDREEFRSKMQSQTCTAETVEYDAISTLRALTDNPSKQALFTKRRNS